MRARQRAEHERERTPQPSLTQRLNTWLAGGSPHGERKGDAR
jgi:hypothetical protein